MRLRFSVPAGCVVLGLMVASPLRADEQADSIRALLAANEASAPVLDEAQVGDAEYAALFNARENLQVIERIKLIGDLWRAEPNAPELAELMKYRWENCNRIWGLSIAEEVEQFATAHPDAHDTTSAGWFAYAMTATQQLYGRPDEQLAAAESFVNRYPDDARGATLLSMASMSMNDPEQRKALTERIISSYPDSDAAKQARGALRQLDGVGKPFELSFTDSISGTTISMEDLRGKVVVIDFWATWCGPCVAEIPHLKELYAKFKDSGLEVIGINLDEKAQTMIDYCTKNGLAWPQYCEGKGWQSKFSQSWGISGIPTVFLVDKQGLLHSTEARGQLDGLIPQLLAAPNP